MLSKKFSKVFHISFCFARTKHICIHTPKILLPCWISLLGMIVIWELQKQIFWKKFFKRAINASFKLANKEYYKWLEIEKKFYLLFKFYNIIAQLFKTCIIHFLMSFIVSRRKTKNRFEFISWSDINAKSFWNCFCSYEDKKNFVTFFHVL